METKNSKTLRQEVGTEKWRSAKGLGTFYYHMGFGKTLTAIKCIEKFLEKHENRSVIIITPSEHLMRHWNGAIKSYFPSNITPLIIIYTINYLVKNKTVFNTDLLVIDEIHEFDILERFKYINKESCNYKYGIGLSGTLPPKFISKIQPYLPVIDTITQKECTENGWISNFIEYNVSCELNEFEQSLYDRYSIVIKDNLSKFGKNGLNLASKCLQGGIDEEGKFYEPMQWCYMWAFKNGWKHNLDLRDEDEKAIDDLWNPKKVIGYARNLMLNVRARKDIIYNAYDKFIKAKELILKYPDRKVIIFNQSTKMADRFIEVPDCVIYHSKLQTQYSQDANGKLIKLGSIRLKKLAIEKIKNNICRRLSTVNALDRGLDIPDINLAITTAGYQNPNQYKQRSSRSTRLNLNNINEIVLIVNFYIAGTRENPSVDETWLKKRQKGVDHEILWVNDINNIEIPYDNQSQGVFKNFT